MQRKNIHIIHIIFWSLSLIAIGLSTVPQFGRQTYFIIIWDFVIYAVSYIFIFYLFYYFITIKILKKNYVKYFIIIGLLFTILFSMLASVIHLYVLYPEVFQYSQRDFTLEYVRNTLMFIETNFIFALSGSLIKIAILWYVSFLKQKEIEKQLISSELALLKTQINPDFLLNTLKDFKSKIGSKTEMSINIIDKLAEIMNYMLYESLKEKVRMEKEINFIKTYLDLQKIRFENEELVDFNYPESIKIYMIAPLIFLPFIEDAFKPGILINIKQPVRITFEIVDSFLSFEITNPIYSSDKTEIPYNKDNNNSIRRRLDLLFENNYFLEEKIDENKRAVKLKINMTI